MIVETPAGYNFPRKCFYNLVKECLNLTNAKNAQKCANIGEFYSLCGNFKTKVFPKRKILWLWFGILRRSETLAGYLGQMDFHQKSESHKTVNQSSSEKTIISSGFAGVIPHSSVIYIFRDDVFKNELGVNFLTYWY